MTTFAADTLADLFAHLEWGDASVWRAVLAHPPAAADERVRDLLRHIHVVQRAFLQVWAGQTVEFPAADALRDLSALQQWTRPVYGEMRAVLAARDAEALSRPIVMPWVPEFENATGRRFAQPTLAETMFQITSHTTHHRAQVNARLRELGGAPPLVDFIAWVWFGRPAADWPDARGPAGGAAC